MFIYLESGGETIKANEGAARMFGGTVEEFVGTRTSKEQWGYVSPEDRLRAESLVAAQNGSLRDCEARVRRKNGEIFTGQVSYERVEIAGQKCLVSITRDVTEPRRMEAEATQSRALLQAAFESSPAGVVLAEAPDATITLANSAAMKIFGSIPIARAADGDDKAMRRAGIFRSDGTRYLLDE